MRHRLFEAAEGNVLFITSNAQCVKKIMDTAGKSENNEKTSS